MTYEPPTNPSLWQVLLADEEGYVSTPTLALDEYGPESHVEISIRRMSALPTPMSGMWHLTNRPEDEADIATEWKLDMVDDIGELDHLYAQLKVAEAMAAGLNAAIANEGDWNRGTELAAALHNLADKFATFTGAVPGYMNLTLHFYDGSARQRNDTAVANVDALAEALLGIEATDQKSSASGWYRRAKTELAGGLTVDIQTIIPVAADKDPRR